MIIYKCDKCGKTEETKKGQKIISHPTGWFNIAHGNYSRGRSYHVCPDCRKELDIPDDYGKAEAFVGDQLIELIGEIVIEQMENH